MMRIILAGLLMCMPLPAKAEDNEAVMDISAASCILIDNASGSMLYEKSSDTQYPMAGTARWMDVLVSLDSDQEKVKYTVPEGVSFTSGVNLAADTEYSLEDLRYATLLANHDDTAYGVSEVYSDTLDRMNKKAQELDMTDTSFTSVYGAEDGAVTTAHDVAMLARAYTSDDAKVYYAASSYTPKTLPDNTAISRTLMTYDGLTGELDTASTSAGTISVVTAERDGLCLTAAVMQETSADAAHKDITLLLNYGFEHYQNVTIDKDTVGTKEVDIEKGNKIYHVTFSLGSSIQVLMAKDVSPENLNVSIITENENDPDEVSASAVVTQSGKEVGRLEMEKDVETETVEKETGMTRFNRVAAAAAGIFALLFLLKHVSKLIKPQA